MAIIRSQSLYVLFLHPWDENGLRMYGYVCEKREKPTCFVTLTAAITQIHSDGYLSLLTEEQLSSSPSSNESSSQGSAYSSGSTPDFGQGSGSGVVSGVTESGVMESADPKGNLTTLFSTDEPLIGVLLTDVDTSGTGDVYYRYGALYFVGMGVGFLYCVGGREVPASALYCIDGSLDMMIMRMRIE